MINWKILPLVVFFLGMFYFGSLRIGNLHMNVLSLASGVVIRVPSDYSSITEALAHALDGDTIIVEPGTYNEYRMEVNRTVKIIGMDREGVIVNGGGTSDFIFKINAHNAVIENLTLQNTILTGEVASAVYLYNVMNVTVDNLIVKNVLHGLQLVRSNFSQILNNHFMECNRGVFIRDSSCNSTIVGNTFENVSMVIYIADSNSQYTKVFHNNFVSTNLTVFAATSFFDGGYPLGGNYWSNHFAVDFNHGVEQNLIGSDGIFDEAYPSFDDPLDRYPLAHPFLMFDVDVEDKSFEVYISSNATLNSYNLNVSEKSLVLILNGVAGSSGSCRVVIPKELLSSGSLGDWSVLCDGENVPYLYPYEDEYFTYLYYSYVQSTSSKIQINGTWVVTEFSVLTVLFMFCILLIMGIKIKCLNV
ncbi:MAG: NosD domain-containing protein [Candidatus Bathyarchaeia archaeon]